MTNPTLERAARALAEADAKGRANLYDRNPELYTRLARAVLMAVMRPDDDLIDRAVMSETDYWSWQNTIQAILNEDQPEQAADWFSFSMRDTVSLPRTQSAGCCVANVSHCPAPAILADGGE